MLALLLTLACGAPADVPRASPAASVSREEGPEGTDHAWSGQGGLRGGGVSLAMEGTTLFGPERIALATGLYEAPVVNDATLCAVGDIPDGKGALQCWSAEGGSLGQPVTVVSGGRPDRVAVADTAVAWVASPDGLPQVFVGDTLGRSPPRPLTNVGLARPAGGPPPGFVPPPHRDTLHFDGDRLRWQTADGAREVSWR